jgi:hypothetical protein
MIWLRRILLLPCLAGAALILGYFFGHEALTSGGYQTGALLALSAGITLIVLLRLFAAVAIGMSMLLGLMLLASIAVAASYYLFEREQDRWFNNQTEVSIQIPPDQRNRTYLKAMGIEPNELPIFNWFMHAEQQINSGLSSQQLTPNQLGKPFPTMSADEVWFNWLSQFMMLSLGLLAGVWFGSKRN